jgi:hypothetical protein
VTPPGYATANLATAKCAADTYRPDWKPANQAANCLACGSGVKAELTDRLKVYPDVMDPSNYTYESITTSSDDCCESFVHCCFPAPLLLFLLLFDSGPAV